MIAKDDIPGFRFDSRRDEMGKYLRLKFAFETSDDPEWAAVNLCSEQSTAQWMVGEGDLRPRHAAKLVSYRLVDESRQPLYPLPSTVGKKRFLRCEAEIVHPYENFGPNLPNLLSAVAGEGVFYVPGIHTVQLKDIEFPNVFLQNFAGPRLGLPGLRENLQIQARPFFVGVVKPNLGLLPKTFAALAGEALEGGLDVAKDDEMLADPVWCPFAERVYSTGAARRRAEQKSGCPKMYIANVTAEFEHSLKLAVHAVQAGANAIMVNPVMTGLGLVRRLRDHLEVPIMGHFAGVAAWGRLPYFGVRSVVFSKLMRLAGCDLVGIAGFGARMQTTAEEVLENIAACLEPMGNLRPSLPIPGGSETAETLAEVYQKVGHVDFGFVSGRGIFSHSEGPGAGARSVVHAWERIARE